MRMKIKLLVLVLSAAAVSVLLFGLLSQPASSQPAGSVTQSTTPPVGIVTALATIGAQPVKCTFQAAYDAVLINCFVAGVIAYQETTQPAIGSSVGSTAIFFLKLPNVITWTIKQPSEDVFTWTIGANGTVQSGNF